MRKSLVVMLALICLLINGCGNLNVDKGDISLGEVIFSEDKEYISNQIPEWVSEYKCTDAFYVVASDDIEKFNSYAESDFPRICDASWTQEQSDSVYIGRGFELFLLDKNTQINRIILYPVILNGVIVGAYQVYDLFDTHQMHSQLSPKIVNELNAIMNLTSEQNPAFLGYNNNNLIAIIGDTYYVLEKDYLEHKEVDVNTIPSISLDKCYNVMEIFCAERNANVDDWVVVQ